MLNILIIANKLYRCNLNVIGIIANIIGQYIKTVELRQLELLGNSGNIGKASASGIYQSKNQDRRYAVFSKMRE